MHKYFFILFFVSISAFCGVYDPAEVCPQCSLSEDRCAIAHKEILKGFKDNDEAIQEIRVAHEIRSVSDSEKFNRLDDLLDHSSTLLDLIGILTGVLALFGSLGAIYIWFDVARLRKGYKKTVEEIKQDHNAARLKIDTDINEFKSSLEEEQQQIRIMRDRYTRINRLITFVNLGKAEQEVFYADLSQLGQNPDPTLKPLIDIISASEIELDEDIRKLIERICSDITS